MLHREQHPDRGHTASHDGLDALMESLVDASSEALAD